MSGPTPNTLSGPARVAYLTNLRVIADGPRWLTDLAAKAATAYENLDAAEVLLRIVADAAGITSSRAARQAQLRAIGRAQTPPAHRTAANAKPLPALTGNVTKDARLIELWSNARA